MTSAVQLHPKGDPYPVDGMVFVAHQETIQESLETLLFGMPAARFKMIRRVRIGTPIFLFDMHNMVFHGCFEAVSPGCLNLDPQAFGGEYKGGSRYPAQVQVIYSERYPPALWWLFENVPGLFYAGTNKVDQLLNVEQIECMREVLRKNHHRIVNHLGPPLPCRRLRPQSGPLIPPGARPTPYTRPYGDPLDTYIYKELSADYYTAHVPTGQGPEFVDPIDDGSFTTVILKNLPVGLNGDMLVDSLGQCGYHGCFDYIVIRQSAPGWNGHAIINFTTREAAEAIFPGIGEVIQYWPPLHQFHQRPVSWAKSQGIAGLQADADFIIPVVEGDPSDFHIQNGTAYIFCLPKSSGQGEYSRPQPSPERRDPRGDSRSRYPPVEDELDEGEILPEEGEIAALGDESALESPALEMPSGLQMRFPPAVDPRFREKSPSLRARSPVGFYSRDGIPWPYPPDEIDQERHQNHARRRDDPIEQDQHRAEPVRAIRHRHHSHEGDHRREERGREREPQSHGHKRDRSGDYVPSRPGRQEYEFDKALRDGGYEYDDLPRRQPHPSPPARNGVDGRHAQRRHVSRERALSVRERSKEPAKRAKTGPAKIAKREAEFPASRFEKAKRREVLERGRSKSRPPKEPLKTTLAQRSKLPDRPLKDRPKAASKPIEIKKSRLEGQAGNSPKVSASPSTTPTTAKSKRQPIVWKASEHEPIVWKPPEPEVDTKEKMDRRIAAQIERQRGERASKGAEQAVGLSDRTVSTPKKETPKTRAVTTEKGTPKAKTVDRKTKPGQPSTTSRKRSPIVWNPPTPQKEEEQLPGPPPGPPPQSAYSPTEVLPPPPPRPHPQAANPQPASHPRAVPASEAADPTAGPSISSPGKASTPGQTPRPDQQSITVRAFSSHTHGGHPPSQTTKTITRGVALKPEDDKASIARSQPSNLPSTAAVRQDGLMTSEQLNSRSLPAEAQGLESHRNPVTDPAAEEAAEKPASDPNDIAPAEQEPREAFKEDHLANEKTVERDADAEIAELIDSDFELGADFVAL